MARKKSEISETLRSRGCRWRRTLRCSELRKQFSCCVYQQLVDSKSRHDPKILRDISRTFPNDPLFASKSREQSLFRILHAYSVFDPEIGYCQGMAFVAGTLRMHMDEEDAFWAFCQILGSEFNLRVVYDEGNPALHECMNKFEHYLTIYRPALAEHLRNQNVKGFMYNSHWFLTFFVYRFRFDLIPQIWDLIFEHGVLIVFKLGLLILDHFEDQLLEMEFETILPFFNHLPEFPEDRVCDITRLEVEGLTSAAVDLFRYGWSNPEYDWLKWKPKTVDPEVASIPDEHEHEPVESEAEVTKVPQDADQKKISMLPTSLPMRPTTDRLLLDRVLNIILGLPSHYTPPPPRTLLTPKDFLKDKRNTEKK